MILNKPCYMKKKKDSNRSFTSIIVFLILSHFFLSNGDAETTSQGARRLLTLGLVADNHYDTFPAGEKAPWESMHHWMREQYKRTTTTTLRRYDVAKDKMDEAIRIFNDLPEMNAVVNLGDLVNNDLMWNLRPILDSFNRAKAPHYSILGNHDLRAHNDRFGKLNKTQELWIMEKLGLLSQGRWYYTIDHPPFRFVFLDSMTNDAENTNGTTKEIQTAWLKTQLDSAKAAGRVTILFAHVPIGFETNRLGPLLKQYNQMPLVFSGHNHKGDYNVQGPHKVHCVTLPGQIETLTNAFAILEVYEDRAELTGFGRVPSRILPFQEPVANLLRHYDGPLTHDLSAQCCQPPKDLWANEILQRPPKLQLNIPGYRKPILPPSIVQSSPRTRLYDQVISHWPPRRAVRGPEETVDLTSATKRRTLLFNGEVVKPIELDSGRVVEKTYFEPPVKPRIPVDSLNESVTFYDMLLWIPVLSLSLLLLFKLLLKTQKGQRRRQWGAG